MKGTAFTEPDTGLLSLVESIPVIDSHIHMGSLPAIGETTLGFAADRTHDIDICDVGVESLIRSVYPGQLLGQCRSNLSLAEAVDSLKGTGVHQVLDRAFRDLFDISLKTAATLPRKLDDRVREAYRRYRAWGGEVLQLSSVEAYMKPVYSEYLARLETTPFEELEGVACHPVLRIENLVLRSSSSASLMEMEMAVEQAFEDVDRLDVRALKHALAYRRSLVCREVSRDEADGDSGGEREQDYLMNLILGEAQKRRMVIQIHTGMGPLVGADPALLEPLFSRYPDVHFVLLHTYPFHSGAACLARNYDNVHLDAAWLAILSPELLSRVLQEWLQFVPVSKIMFSSDATFPEETYGAWCLQKDVLTSELSRLISNGVLDESGARMYARAMLCENAGRLYQIK